jgi:hypothetical protein
MVESAPIADGDRMKMLSKRGIVLQPRNPFDKLSCAPVQWGLSSTDLDVNYIAHFVKLPSS